MTTPPNTHDASQIAQEIRAGLEGVTPGPWKRTPIGGTSILVAATSPQMSVRPIPIGFRESEGYSIGLPFWDDAKTGIREYRPDFVEFSHGDASHIARCSPDRLTILLDAFDAQAREIAELRGRTPDEELVDQQQAMQEEIAELREALEPFAKIPIGILLEDAKDPVFGTMRANEDGDLVYETYGWPQDETAKVIVGDLRRARSALRTREKSNG